MSSLRLALKQSLQEAGHANLDDNEKKKRKSKKLLLRKSAVISERGERPGQPPRNKSMMLKKRKRGRPRKHPQPDDDDDETGDTPGLSRSGSHDSGTRKKHSYHDDEDDGHSSSENQFSYDEEEEEDESHADGEGGGEEEDDHDDGEGEEGHDDGEGEDDDDMHSDDGAGRSRPTLERSDSHRSQSSVADTHHSETSSVKPPSGLNPEEDEMRKRRKMLKKKLKHSAANTIQSQWKKKKKVPSSTSDADGGAVLSDMASERPSTAAVASHETEDSKPSPRRKEGQATEQGSPTGDEAEEAQNVKKKRKKKSNGVVPPPSNDVLEWARNMSEKKCRKHIAQGLRIKVRFATKVKRDGKLVKKKIWYGGRVAAVSKKGSKIRIKYDDGTSEISKFPDKDVVVDAEMNGEHEIPADRFLPPPEQPMQDGESETVKPEEQDPLKQDVPSEIPAVEPTVTKEVTEHDSPITQNIEKESSSPSAVTQPVADPTKETMEAREGQDIEKIEEKEKETASKSDDPMTPAPAQRLEKKNGPDLQSGKSSVSPGISLLTSPEEGELSPGITSQKKADHEALPKESAPAVESLSPGLDAPKVDAPPTEPQQDQEMVSTKPKLEIHIPGRAALEKLSSPKSTPAAEKSEKLIDDILVDTPVIEDSTKRKKNFDGDVAEDEPPKRKIKLAVEKAASESNDQNTEEKPDSEGLPEPSEAMEDNESDTKEEPKILTIKLKVPQPPLTDSNETDIAAPTALHEKKKKKKKVDRTKSPKAKSTLNKGSQSPTAKAEGISAKPLEPSGEIALETLPSTKVDAKTDVGTGKKEDPKSSSRVEVEDMEVDQSVAFPKFASLKSQSSLDSMGSASRTGRKAAQQAKEKLNTKEREKDGIPVEGSKKKKKRRRADEAEEDEAVDDGMAGTEWVQCDSCGKWRILPSDVISSLPKLWYCRMNVYDPKRSSCDAPEQSQKQLLKELRKAKKRAKRMEVSEMEIKHDETRKEKQPIAIPAATSPRPPKAVKSGPKAKEKEKENIDQKKNVTTSMAEENESGSDSQKDEKKKGRKVKPQEIPDLPQSVEAVVEVKKPGRKRGRPARNPATTPSRPPSQESKDEDNVEWVQCEKCEKWRKLPPELSADELPDTWYCSMNTWNAASASCNAAEDKADSQHHEVGTSEWQLRQTHAGKYSYRQMIFGVGARKQNRPMSERSRAAESLFIKPVVDDDHPIPTTQYSKSSAFLPRTSNFNRTNVVEDKGVGLFDVLSNSTLWAELRAMEVGSTAVSGLSYPKFQTYENLPDDIKDLMQAVIIQILGENALTGDRVIREAQHYPWDETGNGLGAMLGYCNADIIINTLLSLVRDGIVEMTTMRDPKIPVSQWIPKYRRVRTQRALAAEEAIKASKCMKIAKPWKHRDEETTEWISGKDAFY